MNIKSVLGLGVAMATVVTTSGAFAQDATAPADVTPVSPSTNTVISTGATPMPYGGDVPTKETSYPNRPLLITSALIGVATYVPTAAIGATSSRDEDKYLFIPVAGPWIELGNRDCNARPCENDTTAKVLIIGSGILQGIGAIGTLSSFFIPETKRSTTTAKAPEKPSFAVAPTHVGYAGYGLGAVGTF